MIRTLVRSAALAAVLVASACKDSSGPSTADAIIISNGVAVTNVSGGANTRKYYKIVVPTGATRLRVETEGGTGDVDLVIRWNRLPSLLEFDCGSFDGENDDGCDMPNPEPGNWYIMLFGAGDNGYSGATLTATVTAS